MLEAVRSQGGVFRCGRPHFMAQKLRMKKIMVCKHGQGGGEVNFSRFYADVFYGHPLSFIFYSCWSG